MEIIFGRFIIFEKALKVLKIASEGFFI